MKQAISAPHRLRRTASLVVRGPALASAVGRSTPGCVQGRIHTAARPDSLAHLGLEHDPPHGIPLERPQGVVLSSDCGGAAKTRYGTTTYVHEGRQYVVLQTGPTLTAAARPE